MGNKNKTIPQISEFEFITTKNKKQKTKNKKQKNMLILKLHRIV